MSGVSSAVWRSMRSSRDGARSTRWRSPACANGWPASARRIPAAFPAGTPLRLLGGFAGNGRRFRHGPWASGWLSAGVVRRRARRPGEIPAYGGVSGWFGLVRPAKPPRSLQFTGGVRGKQWDGRPLQGVLVTSTAFRLALTKRRREAVAC